MSNYSTAHQRKKAICCHSCISSVTNARPHMRGRAMHHITKLSQNYHQHPTRSPAHHQLSIAIYDTPRASDAVRQSVPHAPVYDENGLTYCHRFSPYGSPIILVLPASNIFTKFRRDHPCGGAKYR